MTFLQPIALFGLPLVLLPVIIHLINRQRHRTQNWAAMRFLLQATRESTNRAKLRHFILLAVRVLSLLALVLVLGRPLSGGWAGSFFGGAPDAILILLDRSASMESRAGTAQPTFRESSVRQLADAASSFAGRSTILLIDSATGEPAEIADLDSLDTLPATSASDTTADFPALLQRALEWIEDNDAGVTEIWMASDLQETNWLPDDARWPSLNEGFKSLPQSIQFRLLDFSTTEVENTATRVDRVRRDGGEAQLDVTITRTSARETTLPVSIEIEGDSRQFDLPLDGRIVRWRPRIPIPSRDETFAGTLSIPNDANEADNRFHFVIGKEVEAGAIGLIDDAATERIMGLAATAHLPEAGKTDARWSTRNSMGDLSGTALIVWQKPLPDPSTATELEAFLRQGGSVVFLPSNQGEGTFRGIRWGQTESATQDEAFAAGTWEQQEGPLADTEEGFTIPIDDVRFFQRRQILGAQSVIASFEDGAPLLVRQVVGKGTAWFLASLPDPRWSSLIDGTVLVPMIQRMLEQGTQRLSPITMFEAGDSTLPDQASVWTPLAASGRGIPRFDAGIYRSNGEPRAVNRPDAEDSTESILPDELAPAFDGLDFASFGGDAQDTPLQSEVWKSFLWAMLLLVLIESALMLPRAGRKEAEA